MDDTAAESAFEAACASVAAGADAREEAARLVAEMTPEEQLWCLDGDAPTWAGLEHLGEGGYHQATFRAARVERLGIPGIEFSDGPRGVVIGDATCFPVSIARGATWDPDLEERVGEAIGRELRRVGATLFGGVCVNLLRHPAWGRAQETYGEDPHHVGEMGAALTRGIQRHAMATVKHFAVNSMENARFKVDIAVDEVALHEVYLPHFRRIVDEGVACVMSAYNQVNGTYCGDHRELLTSVLRDEWGFEGFVISDWIFGMRDAARSVAAGLDIEMPYRMVRASHLRSALESGDVAWADVDVAVTRVIATLLRFAGTLSAGDLGGPAVPTRIDAHADLAREVAGRSVVLLRNEQLDDAPALPLDARASLAVIGPLAAEVNLGDGGSSDVWTHAAVPVLDGLRARVGDVAFADGGDQAEAARVAARADVAVVVVGYTADDEGEFIGDLGVDLRHLFPAADEAEVVDEFRARIAELPAVTPPDHYRGRPGVGFSRGGDRTTLRLPAEQVDLIDAVAAANRCTVVVIQAGSAVITSEWDTSVAAVLQMFYGGDQAGPGLADVLFGDVNPSARLPFTVPADEAHLPPFDRDADSFTYDRWHGWWHAERAGHRPAYPFGFGLSYSDYELGEVGVTVTDGGDVLVGVRVANVGARDGADVVQVSARLPDAEAPRRLVGFRRVAVAAGATERVELTVPRAALATRDPAAHAWIEPAGIHEVTVARFAGDPAGVTVAIDLG